MGFRKKVRFWANERLDLPDIDNLQDYIYQYLGKVNIDLMTSLRYIVKGFVTLNNGGATIKVETKSGAFFNTESSVSGLEGVYWIGSGDGVIDPDLTATLANNAVNYVEIEPYDVESAPDTRAFWDAVANNGLGDEFSQVVNTCKNIRIRLRINTVAFSGNSNYIPISKVTVSSGSISSIEDSRPLFFSLMSDYNWPGGRLNLGATNFTGGDKSIKTFKELIDAVTTSIKEIKGTQYWYNEGGSVSGLMGLFSDNNMILTNSGSVSWDAFVNGGTLSWAQKYVLKDAFRNEYEIPAGNTFSLFVSAFSEDEFLYLKLKRPEFFLVNGNIDGVGTCRINDPDGFSVGQKVFIGSMNQTGIQTTITSISPTAPWIITVPTSLAAYTTSQGAYIVPREYSLNKELRNTGDLKPDINGNIDSNVYIICGRTSGKVYFRANTLELDTGETGWLGDGVTQALLTYMGASDENDDDPDYTSEGGPYRITDGDPLNIAIAKLDKDIRNILNSNPVEEVFEVAVETDTFNATTLQWVNDNNIPDIAVFVNGRKVQQGASQDFVKNSLTQLQFVYPIPVGSKVVIRNERTGSGGGGYSSGEANTMTNLGTGVGVYKQKVGVDLRLRSLKAGSGVSLAIVGDDIVITSTGGGGGAEPYYVSYITGQTGLVLGTGYNYNIATDKLDVFRNGIHEILSLTQGSAIDRYTETTANTVTLGQNAISTEVFIFINEDVIPTFKTITTSQVGTVLSVPSYDVGTDKLRVYRNGILMNASGIGNTVDQYTETSSTSITLAEAAVASDVFVFHQMGYVPNFRENITGVTGTIISLSNSYNVGDKGLLVYRNGVLLLNSTSLGNSVDRYQETSNTSITLEVAAVATDVFYFIDK